MNVWSNPDLLAPQEAMNMALFLEARGHAPDQQQVYTTVITALDPQAGARVLDLGCGTGIIARHLARRVGETGVVVGVDLSEAMLEVARQHADHPALRFESGDATALTYDDNHFDHALAARLVMHAPEPHAVLREVRRVVRVGGRLALLERDWGTFAVDHSDRALTRRILDWRCDHIDGNNWTGRQLARLCAESGWHVQDIRPVVTVARDAQSTLLGSLRHAGQLAAQHNIISAAEHDGWIDEIEQRLKQCIFFATINEYIVIAERV
jgi:2-polyprenyl-3-methyl-5-hydroxy-6-metoxy-1,4-benzoquinol methylase